MDKNIRRQLTLFVETKDAGDIENIRKKFNPVQYKLINCHVTLCREEEIENIAVVLENLHRLDTIKITILFGQATRFGNGLGVLLPALGDNEQFHQLRLKVLTGLGMTVRRHEPHITLMHPGNSICTDETFKTIQETNLPASLTFDNISFIEQVDGGQWQTLTSQRSFHLHKTFTNKK
ncbi:MAG: 2'-5' RNA ligase family protein [Ginsengibacter sp.]